MAETRVSQPPRDFDVERQGTRHTNDGDINFENTEPYDICSWFLICVSYFLVVIT